MSSWLCNPDPPSKKALEAYDGGMNFK